MIIVEQYLLVLERCLRLEARVAELEGYAVAELPPIVYLDPPTIEMPLSSPLPWARRIYRTASADEIAQMRELRARGFYYIEIAHRMQVSHSTARRYTADVPLEREVHAT